MTTQREAGDKLTDGPVVGQDASERWAVELPTRLPGAPSLRVLADTAIPLTDADSLMSHQAVLITEAADETLRALADPLRARIVEMLASEQLCVCHIVELTGARQTNVSNHLRVLRQAGLVEAEPAGRYTYYRLIPHALARVAEHYSNLAERARHANQIRRPCS